MSMKPRCLIVAVLLICFAATLPAVDKQLVGLMMPDAKILAGVNATQILTSPYGQYLVRQVPTGEADFQQFVLATGFDPTRNITEIVAASNGTVNQHQGL